jgi:Helix-turn-helix domain
VATQTDSDRAPEIGAVLRDERRRQQIDIKTVEERTKIRVKYLRALENDEWDVLPGPAYTKGFLRAYAGTLGLDGDALLDDYRRRYEEPGRDSQDVGEPLLDGPGARRRSGVGRGERIAIGVAVAIAVVIVLGIATLGIIAVFSGGSSGGGSGKAKQRGNGQAQGAAHHGKAGATQPAAPPGPVALRLVARTDTQICLLNAHGRVLIANEAIPGGTTEGPFVSPRFTVRLNPAQADVFVNGRQSRVARLGTQPAAYRVGPSGVKSSAYSPGCP